MDQENSKSESISSTWSKIRTNMIISIEAGDMELAEQGPIKGIIESADLELLTRAQDFLLS